MTLSAIAREFECTPSAISYIVRKAEASGGQEDEAMGSEPSLPLDTPAAEPAPVAEAPKAAAPRTDAPKRDSHRAPKADGPREPARTAAPAESAPADTPAPAPAVHTSHGETLKLSRPEAGPPVSQAPAQTVPAQPAAAPADAAAAKAPSAAPATAPAAPRAEPGTPVDAVEARLRETAKACLGAYRTWRQQPGEGSIQTLSDAVHELRKALARIEIDMSASRKEEQAIRPIPIPAHRAARRHQ